MKSRQKKVLVAVPTNGTDGRLRIAGILKYARARASWDIHFVCSRTSFTDEEVHDVLKSGLDGCILAAYTPAVKDILAVQVARACHEAHIRIPSELALVGCDNDELLCEGMRPTIASILPGFEKAGFAAAKALASMMHGQKPAESVMRIPGALLVQRSSTSNLPPAVAVVNAAMDYIKTHALEGISTADVIAKLHVSRALLNLRFRQLRNESVMDAILGIRLAAVRDRIEKTDRKFLTIGAECGFRNPDYLKRLFRKRFGMSMRAWRLKNRSRRASAS